METAEDIKTGVWIPVEFLCGSIEEFYVRTLAQNKQLVPLEEKLAIDNVTVFNLKIWRQLYS